MIFCNYHSELVHSTSNTLLFVSAVQTRKTRKVNLERLRMKERRDAQHSRYRHLYQIRRSNGDVIARVRLKFQVILYRA